VATQLTGYFSTQTKKNPKFQTVIKNNSNKNLKFQKILLFSQNYFPKIKKIAKKLPKNKIH